MTSLEIGKLVAIGGAGWLILTLLGGWAFSRWKRWEREWDVIQLDEWRRQERVRWRRE